jgi:hypothetical protein
MGISRSGRRVTAKEGIGIVLDVRAGRGVADEYIAFRTAGEPADGEHRCSGCGYGVVVRTELPRCPMCGGGVWEPAGTRRRGGAPAR